MSTEIRRQPDPEPGMIRYTIHHNGRWEATIDTGAECVSLLAAILERAVEGLIREGRVWTL